jgi:hypothetical protein
MKHEEEKKVDLASLEASKKEKQKAINGNKIVTKNENDRSGKSQG